MFNQQAVKQNPKKKKKRKAKRSSKKAKRKKAENKNTHTHAQKPNKQQTTRRMNVLEKDSQGQGGCQNGG